MHVGNELEHWGRAFTKYGWASCPVLFNAADPLHTDNPATSAMNPAVTRCLSLGVPHPQYGVMRAAVHLTSAASLTRLASVVQQLRGHEFALQGLPHLYVGRHAFRDTVQADEREVLGILVFRAASGEVQHAPMTLVLWRGMWLPCFEDANNWVMTGWDAGGRVAEIFKPFGWGCAGLSPDMDESQGSCQSC